MSRDDDGGVVNLNESAAAAIFQFFEDAVDLFAGVDEFKLDGETIGELELYGAGGGVPADPSAIR